MALMEMLGSGWKFGAMSSQDGAKWVTVLVVEDETVIREAAVEMLERAGFRVLPAVTGDEALEVLAAQEEQRGVNVIFTDIRMPGPLDGLRLARLTRQRWPWVQAVVTSGHGIALPGELPCGGRFLPKPYSCDDLLKAIKAVHPAL